MLLQDLVGIVDDHVAHASRTCDEDGRIEPTVSLITSLESKMKAHSESIGTDFALSQLFQNFLFTCSRSVGWHRQHMVFAFLMMMREEGVVLLTLSCVGKALLRHVSPNCISCPNEQFADVHHDRAQSPNLRHHWSVTFFHYRTPLRGTLLQTHLHHREESSLVGEDPRICLP
jgi:hypothetical protein